MSDDDSHLFGVGVTYTVKELLLVMNTKLDGLDTRMRDLELHRERFVSIQKYRQQTWNVVFLYVINGVQAVYSLMHWK